jgi:hypothetical protein
MSRFASRTVDVPNAIGDDQWVSIIVAPSHNDDFYPDIGIQGEAQARLGIGNAGRLLPIRFQAWGTDKLTFAKQIGDFTNHSEHDAAEECRRSLRCRWL